MATNVKKAKKKIVKKTYDTKIVKYIAIGVTALVLILLASFFITNVSTNYVAKVDGKKIYNYEYEYFAADAINEIGAELEENIELADDATNEEYTKAMIEAWTDEKRAEAQELALKKAVDYKVGYLVAKSEGFNVSREEKTNIKSNIDYYINIYYQYYSQSGYSYDDIVSMMCGTLDVADYKKVAICQNVTEKYRTSLKEGYSVTEEELRAVYDENPDDYRKISARLMYLPFDTKPTLSVSEPKREDGTVITEELTDITDAEKERLDTYIAAKEEYDKKMAEYKENVDKVKNRAETIAKALNETGKYSETNGEEEIYKDADFATIIKAESKLSSGITNTDGLIEFTASNKLGIDEIDDLVFSYQWNDDRTGIVIVVKPEEESEDKDNAEDGTAEPAETAEPEIIGEPKKPTDIKVVEVDKGVYLVRCEDIIDFDTVEESEEDDEPAEDALQNSIQERIRSNIFDEKATEELDKIIADKIASGKTFTATNKKESRMKKIIDKVLGF